MRKAAIVTGSTKGIGKAIAIQLMREGYFVYINYFHDEDAAVRLKDDLDNDGFSMDYQIVRADISSNEGIEAFVGSLDFEKYELHCLILNAASNGKKRSCFRDISEDELTEMFRINLFSPFFLVQRLADKITDNGSVVFVSSHVGIYPHSTYIPYGLTKSAEIALAKMLVKEFEDKGITVNTVAPAFIETAMFPGNRTQEHLDSIRSKIAVHRFGKAEEVADAVVSIVKNKYINGSVLSIDGGYNYK